MNWNLRTCASRGHVLYAPDEPTARAVVRAVSDDDVELWKCLRCATFATLEDALSGTRGRTQLTAGPVAQVPLVPRGRELRDLFVMRLLAAERAVRGLLMVLLALGAWKFHDSQHRLRAGLAEVTPHLHQMSGWLGVDLTRNGLFELAQELLDVNPKMVMFAGFGLLGYGLLQLLEGVGLWLGRRWGEYVAVLATSAFLPLEIHELLGGVSVVKVAALVVNVAAVVWLVGNGRLFGVRGGHHAYVAARRGDAVLDPAAYVAASDGADLEVTLAARAGAGDVDDHLPKPH